MPAPGTHKLGFGTSQPTNPDLTITVLIHIAHSPLPGSAGQVGNQSGHSFTHSFSQSQPYFFKLELISSIMLVSGVQLQIRLRDMLL